MNNRVLLDIDNTLTDVSLTLEIMKQHFSVESFTVEQLISYNIGDALDITDEEDKAFWKKYSKYISKLSTQNDNTRKMIDKIIKPDDNVVIVTARPQSHEKVTVDWLQAHGVRYDNIIFTNGRPKIDYIEQQELNVIIDDNPHVFTDIKFELLYGSNGFLRNVNKSGTLERYVVDFPYNRNVDSEYRILLNEPKILKLNN